MGFADREILDALSAGVVASALDELAVYANPAACELLDRAPERCIGQPVPLLLGMTLSLADQDFAEPAHECRLDLELPAGPAGVTIRRVDGRGYVCVFRTKSDGRSADARLQRYEREASIGVLLSLFAHEVRNPLASMQASIDMMRPDLPGSEPANALLAIIERQLARLSDLVRSPMLAGSGAPVQRVPCHLHELAASAVSAVALEARHREVIIEVAVSPGLPRVVVDERGVAIAIAELLENAVHASSAGSVVSLSASVHDGIGGAGVIVTGVMASADAARDARRVTIEIADRGYGMERSEIAPALRAFSSTKAGASGLGLPTARHHIEQSGGRLAIESSPLVGTVVRVELPAEELR